MSTNQKMKMLKKPDVTELDGEKVMIDFESGRYFVIKGSGNDIWDIMEDGITVGQIVDKLLTQFDISREQCESEVVAFVEKLVKYGFVELYE